MHFVAKDLEKRIIYALIKIGKFERKPEWRREAYFMTKILHPIKKKSFRAETT